MSTPEKYGDFGYRSRVRQNAGHGPMGTVASPVLAGKLCGIATGSGDDAMHDSSAFRLFDLSHGPLGDPLALGRGTLLNGWSNGTLRLGRGTHFGYVHAGTARLEGPSGTFTLAAGMYFCLPGGGAVRGRGRGLVVTRRGYRGLFQIGGPIERRGRLRYINGCTDSLLVAPVLRGDACLNLLHIPPRVDQTPHTHPSVRVGIVARGRGECRTGEEVFSLRPGRAFVIRPDALHSFHTASSALTVVAYHPDSDFGPSDEDHPMINRTVVASPPVG